VRPKDTQDNATPSGSALAANALLQISAFGDRPDWRGIAETMLASMYANIREYPTAYGKWLQALDFALGPVREIAILSHPNDEHTQAMIDTVWENFDPHRVVAISTYPPKPESPMLLKDRPLLDGNPTAYVCQNFACKQPVNQPQDLARQLSLKAD
jgi:uncharacterized protein YyaL (SSP411 family)